MLYQQSGIVNPLELNLELVLLLKAPYQANLLPLTAVISEGDITIIVENTLALGSDQYSKVTATSNNNQKHMKS